MASLQIPPPSQLQIHDPNLAIVWKKWQSAWNNYELATGVNEKDQKVRIATLLSIIGPDANTIYDGFTWTVDKDKLTVEMVLQKFSDYCIPKHNIPYERHRFHSRIQRPGEDVFAWLTDLRTIGRNCEFDTITVDEIYRDQLVSGISEHKVRDKLLERRSFTLEDAIDIIRNSEIKLERHKAWKVDHDVSQESEINAIRKTHWKRECIRCGYDHGDRRCPAIGKTCLTCNGKNHFAAKCKSAWGVRKITTEAQWNVSHIIQMNKAETQYADLCRFISFKVGSKDFKCQLDTGSDSNVMSIHEYIRLTSDKNLTKLRSSSDRIRVPGGLTFPIEGYIDVHVQRRDKMYKLTFMVLDGEFSNLLGYHACISTGAVSIHDNDLLNQCLPEIKSCSLESSVLTSDIVLNDYGEVFEGIGKLPGQYKLRVDETIPPVIHPPRRIPCALKGKLESEIRRLQDEDIIESVTEPSEWVSSLLVITKKDGTLRICIDPSDLNKAIRREHFPIPTFDEIAADLTGAKYFSVFDAKSGFHQVQLHPDSYHYTTFNTPLGRFRWKRLPFGLSSSPEVFQRKMIEAVDGLS